MKSAVGNVVEVGLCVVCWFIYYLLLGGKWTGRRGVRMDGISEQCDRCDNIVIIDVDQSINHSLNAKINRARGVKVTNQTTKSFVRSFVDFPSGWLLNQ
mmetsp:Transcript_4110/g.5399  ORF Transcript_4110/g.5399 Transcript_4110/m.5399 type:complete len:99 (+) Transcript_4110:1247-1543(+)